MTMAHRTSKKEAVDLIAYCALACMTKKGREALQKVFSKEEFETMLRTVDKMFDNDNQKLERFIIDRIKKLKTKFNSNDKNAN